MAQVLQHNMASALIKLLKQLIEVPSFSKEEDKAADLLMAFLQKADVPIRRVSNNLISKNRYFDGSKPTLLLNSHLDTVKPNAGYTRNPFAAEVQDGKLFGLGSNDAGGALVSLLGAFLYYHQQQNLPFNLVFAATAEEEISGKNGIELIIPELPAISMAIVGEPTQMQMAIAERGLLVLDCVATGKAGHVANNVGINAIYLAMQDIEWFKSYRFEKVSPVLGPVNMNVTMVNAGNAHNQVPDECRFVVDIRLNECYTHEQVLAVIRQHVSSVVKERSTRIKSSSVDDRNPMVMAAQEIGVPLFGSSTTSDMALMPWKAVKIGPGDTRRSHSADEFIYVHEIENAIDGYIKLIHSFSKQLAV